MRKIWAGRHGLKGAPGDLAGHAKARQVTCTCATSMLGGWISGVGGSDIADVGPGELSGSWRFCPARRLLASATVALNQPRVFHHSSRQGAQGPHKEHVDFACAARIFLCRANVQKQAGGDPMRGIEAALESGLAEIEPKPKAAKTCRIQPRCCSDTAGPWPLVAPLRTPTNVAIPLRYRCGPETVYMAFV